MSSKRQEVGAAEQSASIGIGNVVYNDAPFHAWFRGEQQPFVLRRLSLGSAENYGENGGLAVIADGTMRGEMIDRARVGIEVREGGEALVGAFVMGHGKHLKIRALFERLRAPRWFGYVRAHAGGVERVARTPIAFGNDGMGVVDLPVKNVSLERTGTVEEEWTWDLGVATEGEGEQEQERWQTQGKMRVRIYVTAGRPICVRPSESLYHVACAAGGATDAREAEGLVWGHFAGKSGIPLANARGERLTMWQSQVPGNNVSAYVCRGAQALLEERDASCLGWADLLRGALAIHGIGAAVKIVWVDMEALKTDVPSFRVKRRDGSVQVVREVGLMVKRFKWAATGTIERTVTCGVNEVIEPGDFRWKLNLADNPVGVPWEKVDVEVLGQPGHLSERARATGIYCNHAVVLVKGEAEEERWYDPSHGIGPHEELLGYQRELLGVGEEEGGGLFAVVGCRLRTVQGEAGKGAEMVGVGEVFYGAQKAPGYLCLRAVDVG